MIQFRGWSRPSLQANILFVSIFFTLATKIASAQDLDIQHFNPAPGPNDLLNTMVSRPAGEFNIYGALTLDYGNDETHWRTEDGQTVRPVADRFQSNLAITFGLLWRIDFSLVVPVILWQHSRNYPIGSPQQNDIGIGDVRLHVKGALLDNTEGGLGISVGFGLSEPTGRDFGWMSESAVTFSPELTVDYLFRNHFLIAANVGYHFRPDARINSTDTRTDAILARAAVELPFHVYGLSFIGELNTEIASPFPEKFSQTKRLSPVELLGALRWRGDHGSITVGSGVGLNDAYGAPDWRTVLSVGYFTGTYPALSKRASQSVTRQPKEASGGRMPAAAPINKSNDTNAAELSSNLSSASAQGEQPASVKATSQKSKRYPTVRPSNDVFDEIIAGDPDSDGDGLGKEHDACPDAPEDFDQFEDSDGCPDPDNDGDGILDTNDTCPMKKETINGIKDDDGCPDKGKATVVTKDGQLTTDQKVFFATGSDKLDRSSKRLLNQYASFLKMNWTIRLVQIEGFADSRGDPEANVYLSQRRARRVRSYLIKKGVSERRLTAKGFGPVEFDLADSEQPAPSTPQSSAEASAESSDSAPNQFQNQSKERFVTFSVLEQVDAGGEK